MKLADEQIQMSHGNGGELSHRLIQELFIPAFSGGEKQGSLSDGAVLAPFSGTPVMSTDSFVVNPLFFPGGDIGSLAVNGTVNDLVVSGAQAMYLSVGFIIEEGFLLRDLQLVVDSMARAADAASVRIVTGDTKVVEKGAADGLYINTAGMGRLRENPPSGSEAVRPGDRILVSGSVGDHGMALYKEREGMDFTGDIKSDCASVQELVELAMTDRKQQSGEGTHPVRLLRDPTRGGLATTLNEFALQFNGAGIELEEETIPVNDPVRGMCELLGFDPLHVANEGKVVAVVDPAFATTLLERWKAHPLGSQAAIIGKVSDRMPGRVILKTGIGGERLLDMLTGEMLPRIC